MPYPTEFDLYISPDGETYRFQNGTDKFVLSGIGGQGMPTITYRTQRGPFQDGQTVLGFLLEPRVIQLVHRRDGNCRDDFWTNRADFVNLLRPNRQTIGTFNTGVLRKVMPNGTKRDLNVLVQSGPGFVRNTDGRWDEFSFTEAIQFIAFDPIFFDPTAVSVTAAQTAQTELVFPITFDVTSNDIQFGSANFNFDKVITYTGTWKSFPTITITGPIDNPVITNEETEETIFLMRSIADSEIVTISLNFGNKTVTNNASLNLIGDISSDSDLGTFHIAPAPEVTDGVNTINIQGANVTGSTSIVINYNTNYIGI